MLFGLEADNAPQDVVKISEIYFHKDNFVFFHFVLSLIIAGYSGVLSIVWLYYKFNLEVKINLSKQSLMNKRFKLRSNFTVYLKSFLHPRFQSFFCHFIFTLLGVYVSNWFFTLNLFLITNLSQTVSYILRSIFRHWAKLLVTLLLTVLIILSYSFLFLVFFKDQINVDEYGKDVCKNYLNCFFNGINMGMRLGGGMGDFLFMIADPDSDKYWSRFVFDLTFFIFIQLISLNIVSGIIIDTFSELRDELTLRKYDEKFMCFICGLNKWQIEKRGETFLTHRKYTHNLWDYVYFMIRLNSVNSHSVNGIEHYLFEKFKKDDSTWLPNKIFLNRKENIRYLQDNSE